MRIKQNDNNWKLRTINKTTCRYLLTNKNNKLWKQSREKM